MEREVGSKTMVVPDGEHKGKEARVIAQQTRDGITSFLLEIAREGPDGRPHGEQTFWYTPLDREVSSGPELKRELGT